MGLFSDEAWHEFLLGVKEWHSVTYIVAIVVIFVANWYVQATNPSKPALAPWMAVKIAKDVEDDVEEKVKESRYLKDNAKEVPTFQLKELKVGELLGEGSFCEIKEVKAMMLRTNSSVDEKDGRTEIVTKSRERLPNGNAPYAIKHVRTKLLEDKDEFIKAASELVLEAKYLSSLNHRNIITVRGVAKGNANAYETAGGHADSYFVLMDRIESTLKSKLAVWRMAQDHGSGNCPFQKDGNVKGGCPAVTANRLEIVRDLANACEYLHAKRLVYRDFKPSNIGFDWKGAVKLLDFGLVAELPEEGFLTQRTGTVRYMSPECALGKYNCQADVFSLTLILWEILSLQSYFADKETNLDHVKAIMEGKREPLNEMWPIGIRKLMIKGWGGDPAKRPTMKSLGAGLEEEMEKLRQKQDLNEAATNDSQEEKESGGTILDLFD